MTTEPEWKTAPISSTCEVFVAGGGQCGEPTARAYPASGRGWMALCQKHSEMHKTSSMPIDALIIQGETFA